MSDHILQTSIAGTQVEGAIPHLSSDWNNSSRIEDVPNPSGVALIQAPEALLATADREEIPASIANEPRENEKIDLDRDAPVVEESDEARLERLGRQMPEVFGSIWSEIGFVFSISMAQVLTVRQCLTS
jgi:hypothetical protein